jgi:hypothetical protein
MYSPPGLFCALRDVAADSPHVIKFRPFAVGKTADQRAEFGEAATPAPTPKKQPGNSDS